MDREALTRRWPVWFLAGFLLSGVHPARAQSPPSGRNQKAGQTAGTETQTAKKGRRSSSTSGQDTAKAQAKASKTAPTPPRREFSEAYRESLRRTVEKRRELRARRRMGAEALVPPGAIALWPMPPALIIRQTPDVHGEVGSFLDVLRR
jgi:hypothetical protein